MGLGGNVRGRWVLGDRKRGMGLGEKEREKEGFYTRCNDFPRAVKCHEMNDKGCDTCVLSLSLSVSPTPVLYRLISLYFLFILCLQTYLPSSFAVLRRRLDIVKQHLSALVSGREYTGCTTYQGPLY